MGESSVVQARIPEGRHGRVQAGTGAADLPAGGAAGNAEAPTGSSGASVEVPAT